MLNVKWGCKHVYNVFLLFCVGKKAVLGNFYFYFMKIFGNFNYAIRDSRIFYKLKWNLSMASDSDKSSNNLDLDGYLKNNKKQGSCGNTGKYISII